MPQYVSICSIKELGLRRSTGKADSLPVKLELHLFQTIIVLVPVYFSVASPDKTNEAAAGGDSLRYYLLAYNESFSALSIDFRFSFVFISLHYYHLLYLSVMMGIQPYDTLQL
jgi:hypothetical protein